MKNKFLNVLLILMFPVFVYAAEELKTPIETLFNWIPLMLSGFIVNIKMSLVAMLIGLIAGSILGVSQFSDNIIVKKISWVTTQFFRNSPWLVILFVIMLLVPLKISIFGMPVELSDWLKAAIGFSLPIMANVSEIVRGAINSVPIGQSEAAKSLGYSKNQTMYKILLPQCIKRMIPPLMNWFAILVMATPLASIIGVEEAVNLTQQALNSENSRVELLMPFYGFLLIIFFMFCYPISLFTKYL